MQTVTGIQRASVFSPNHIGNDAAIFTGTAEYIREQGYHVTILTEQEFLSLPENPQRVFTMLRNQRAIQRLQQWEQEGCITVNSAFGIENGERERMTNLLITGGIPYPDSIIVDTHEQITPLLKQHAFSSCWIKRGDFHAIHREDVTYARRPEDVQEMLSEYALRGIDRVVINKHLEGDLIKFYGIAGSSFFFWFYPFDNSHSKFGHEEINGKAKGIPFREEELRNICNRAAETLQLIVYGGDCIISPDGLIRIIDFNDWPSFAPCREEAIPVIGHTIIQTINKYS
jgi:Glutathione synthase/Ribosomal protein S6 modification enzyme (glutaminyl transferase)